MTTTDLQSMTRQTKKAQRHFRALNHKLRQKIISQLLENGFMTVTELYEKLHLVQSVCSQHLAILRHAKIVTTRRDGKYIYYSVDTKRIHDLHNVSTQLNAYCKN